MRAPGSRPGWRWFMAWFPIGGAYVFGLLGAASIGVLILFPAIVVTAALAGRNGATQGIPGLVAGFGVALLFVAYLNRDGPGDICTVAARSTACGQEWSPWPWLIAAVVLLAVGFGWFITRRRTARRHPAHQP